MNKGYPTNLTDNQWQILEKILDPTRRRFPRLRKILADGGYQGETLANIVKKDLGCELSVVLRPNESSKKFSVIPKRWIVERSFSWLENFRRVAIDYEFFSESSLAMLQIAFSAIMLKKITLMKSKQLLICSIALLY